MPFVRAVDTGRAVPCARRAYKGVRVHPPRGAPASPARPCGLAERRLSRRPTSLDDAPSKGDRSGVDSGNTRPHVPSTVMLPDDAFAPDGAAFLPPPADSGIHMFKRDLPENQEDPSSNAAPPAADAPT